MASIIKANTITNLAETHYINVEDILNKTGDQTIAGVKTFTSSPVVPSATTGGQAVNKDYADLKLALTAFTGANQSLASNGYQKLPGGLIIQWGLDRPFDGNYGSNALTVNFPIAFPNACFLVNGHSQTDFVGNTGPIYYAISSWNTTSFVRPWWIGRMAWIAIGY